MPTNKVNIREGTVWTVIWWGFKLSQKFLSNVILTRLLTPEIFGIAAVGNALISGATMLSDFGIRQSIVRSERTDQAFYRTAWTLQVIRGVGLTVLILLLASPLETFYKTEGLGVFVAVVAISVLAMGFNNIEVHRDYRHATMRRLALIDNISALVGLVSMVLWAWLSPSYMALAAGAVISTLFVTIATYIVYPRSNCHILLEKSSLDELLTFGRWVMLSTMLAFVTMQFDKLALGKLITMQALGLYSIAWIWASMPPQILGQWAESVFYPLVAEQLRSNKSTNIEWVARRMLISIATMLSIMIYAVADTLVEVIYAAEYQGVATLLRQLSFVVLLYTIDQSYSHFLIAQGRPKEKIGGQALSMLLFVLLIIPVFQWWDIEGVIALLAGCAVVRIVWMACQLFGIRMGELKYDILALGVFFITAPSLHQLNSMQSSWWYRIPVACAEGAVVLVLSLYCYRILKRMCSET